jgi:hypothetical protein
VLLASGAVARRPRSQRMSESSCEAVRGACFRADAVIQRVRDLVIAEGRPAPAAA